MGNKIIEVSNISKMYRLGVIGTGTLSHDINRLLARLRGKEDPYLKVGQINNRVERGNGQYVWSLKDITFDVDEGEVIGIIGKNGAGKSTLLKILSRVTGPTQGNIKIRGRLASLLEVGTGFHPELTARENIFLNGTMLGMTKAEIRSKFDEIVDFSGVERYIDTPVKRFSSGMYVRLAFAVAAHLEPDILVVDEVLAVGDAEFQRKCIGKMKDVSGDGRTVLFVSHNMNSIKALCSRAIYLEKGQKVFDGNVSDGVKRYLTGAAGGSGGTTTEITDKYRVAESGMVYFRQIMLKNDMVEEGNKIPYRAPLLFEVEFDVLEPLNNVLFDLYFYSEDGVSVAYAIHNHNNDPLVSFGEGKYKTLVRLQNHLLPGKYTVNVGVHKNTGQTLDYVQGVIQIEVLRTALGEEADYDYFWISSYTRADSKWEFAKL